MTAATVATLAQESPAQVAGGQRAMLDGGGVRASTHAQAFPGNGWVEQTMLGWGVGFSTSGNVLLCVGTGTSPSDAFEIRPELAKRLAVALERAAVDAEAKP